MKDLISNTFAHKLWLFSLIILVVFGLTPIPALAASVVLSTGSQSVAVGDTVVVTVVMNPQGQKPNVVEGNLSVSAGADKIKISDFSTAGSALSYWLRSPSLDNSASISFAGGRPNGFDKTGILFKVIFVAEAEGRVEFSSANITGYNNDGKATAIPVSISPLSISVGASTGHPRNEWLEIISGDKQSPKELGVTFGQDDSIFDGKKFITISAVDEQSGIDYYEVKEGDWPSARTGTEYVLQNQNESSILVVTAYDKAGNSSRIQLEPGRHRSPVVAIVITAIILVCLAIFYLLAERYDWFEKVKWLKRLKNFWLRNIDWLKEKFKREQDADKK